MSKATKPVIRLVLFYIDSAGKLTLQNMNSFDDVGKFCVKNNLTRYDYALMEGEVLKRPTVAGAQKRILPRSEEDDADETEDVDPDTGTPVSAIEHMIEHEVEGNKHA